jgi:hypothetical protein
MLRTVLCTASFVGAVFALTAGASAAPMYGHQIAVEEVAPAIVEEVARVRRRYRQAPYFAQGRGSDVVRNTMHMRYYRRR